jgi:ABC-type phosphate transport system substrate-binding protein
MTAPPSALRRTVTAVLGLNRSPAGIRRPARRPAYPLGSRILAAILGVQLPERPRPASASQRPDLAGHHPHHSTGIVGVPPPGTGSTMGPRALAKEGRSRLAWVAGALATLLVGGLFSSATLLGSSPADRLFPVSCAKGRLTVVGSTTFQPALEAAAADYERVCGNAEIHFDMRGSTEGLRSLQQEDNPGVRLAFSEGRNGSYEGLKPHPIAVIPFNVVVNRTIDISGLTIQQLRDIYSGETDNWRTAGGPNLGVRIIGRHANSGTRAVFEEKILGRSEPAPSSDNCMTPKDPGAPVVRCEMASTSEVLDKANRIPGAIGYAPLEATDSSAYENVVPVRINGAEPVIDTIESGDYPFWTVEYAYTRGDPPADSVAASFLAFLASPDGEVAHDEHGYFPCTTVAERICARS